MARYSIDDIRKRQAALDKRIRSSEKSVRSAINNVNRKPRRPQNVVSRFVDGAQNASFLLDAAFLGFKLYKTFSKRRRR